MGAWGYKEFENDSGCDFVDDIIGRIFKPLKKKTVANYDYPEIRVASTLLCLIYKAGYSVDAEMLEEATCERCGGEKRTSATEELMNHDWDECYDHTQGLLKESRKRRQKLTEDLLKFGRHEYSCGNFCL